MGNQQKAVELCGSGLLAGVGCANNAGNVGNTNNAYGVEIMQLMNKLKRKETNMLNV